MKHLPFKPGQPFTQVAVMAMCRGKAGCPRPCQEGWKEGGRSAELGSSHHSISRKDKARSRI